MGGALEVRFRELDFLVNVLRVHDLVEVLHADVAAWTGCVGGVVGPGLGVDAPACAVPFIAQAFFESEAAEEDDFVARFADGRDAGCGVPSADVARIVVAQDARELGVGGVAGAFAFEGHDDRFAGVAVEEGEDVVDEVAEVFVACQGDGEDAVDEDEGVFGEVFGAFGLDSDIEEADAVIELFPGADGLASDGGKGTEAGWGVVGAGDGEGGEGCFVSEFIHP